MPTNKNNKNKNNKQPKKTKKQGQQQHPQPQKKKSGKKKASQSRPKKTSPNVYKMPRQGSSYGASGGGSSGYQPIINVTSTQSNDMGYSFNRRELLTEVYGTEQFSISGIDVNPGLSTLLLWGSKIAGNWEEWEMHARIEFVTSVAFVNGKVGVYFDRDAKDGAATDYRAATTMGGMIAHSVVSSPSQAPDLIVPGSGWRYIRTDDEPPVGDLTLYDSGTLYYFTNGCLNSASGAPYTGKIGDLFINYSLRLRAPQTGSGTKPSTNSLVGKSTIYAASAPAQQGTTHTISPVLDNTWDTLGTIALDTLKAAVPTDLKSMIAPVQGIYKVIQNLDAASFFTAGQGVAFDLLSDLLLLTGLTKAADSKYSHLKAAPPVQVGTALGNGILVPGNAVQDSFGSNSMELVFEMNAGDMITTNTWFYWNSSDPNDFMYYPADYTYSMELMEVTNTDPLTVYAKQCERSIGVTASRKRMLIRGESKLEQKSIGPPLSLSRTGGFNQQDLVDLPVIRKGEDIHAWVLRFAEKLVKEGDYAYSTDGEGRKVFTELIARYTLPVLMQISDGTIVSIPRQSHKA